MNTKTEKKIIDLAERRAEARRRNQEPITYNLIVTHRPDEMSFSISGLPENHLTRTVIEDDLVSMLKEVRRYR